MSDSGKGVIKMMGRKQAAAQHQFIHCVPIPGKICIARTIRVAMLLATVSMLVVSPSATGYAVSTAISKNSGIIALQDKAPRIDAA